MDELEASNTIIFEHIPKPWKPNYCSSFTLQSKIALRCPEYKKRVKRLEDVIQKLTNADKDSMIYDISNMENDVPYLRRNSEKVRLNAIKVVEKRNAFVEKLIQIPDKMKKENFAKLNKFCFHLERYHGHPTFNVKYLENFPTMSVVPYSIVNPVQNSRGRQQNRRVAETMTIRSCRTIKSICLPHVSRALTAKQSKNDGHLVAPKNNNYSQLIYEYREMPTTRRSPRLNNSIRPRQQNQNFQKNSNISNHLLDSRSNCEVSSLILKPNTEDGYESGFTDENNEPIAPSWKRIGNSKELLPYGRNINNNRHNNSLQINDNNNNSYLPSSFETVQSLPTPNGSSIMMEEVTERRRMRVLQYANKDNL